MSFVRQTVAEAAVGVGVADTLEGLETLKKPGCAAVIWRRQMQPDVREWLAALAPERLPRGRLVLQPGAVTNAVRHLCAMADMPDGDAKDWLIDDIAHLSQTFAWLMDVGYVRLRLDVVENNACRKFHIDAVRARCVCTYRGRGTQYGISTDGDDPKRVFQVPVGAPILLRGSLWPEKPASGLLHRSPPIEGTGETRLLMVLDPIFDPGAE